LRGTWKLQKGDDSRRASPSYDDDKWSRVLVPSYWETQGLKGYDGFAWYRREFNLAPALRGKRLILLLGRIDDADEVWLNGRRIGKSGHMPYESESYFNDEYYRKLRAYFIPPDLPVSEGRNVIAVRVYDGFMHGGIYEGPIGIIRQDRFRYWEKTHSLDEKSSFTKFIDFLLGR
jgi:sialate O-acetylesterase